jgi:predicted RNA-binding Zn ribbon-like protein
MARQVPASLRLVEAFLNSVDLESGLDDLDSPMRFKGWLTAHRKVAAADTMTQADLDFARDLRDALRSQLRAPDGEQNQESPDRVRLDALAAQVTLRARVAPEGVWLQPAEDGVRGVLGEVLAAMVLAGRDGSWPRLKICREDSCQLAFYDQSKNSSRTWCSMSACGNRNKTRAYRGRQRT